MMTVTMVKHLFKLNPPKIQKVQKYDLVYYSVIVTLISEELCITMTGRNQSMLDIDPGH